MYYSGKTEQYFRNPLIYGCMFNAIKQTGKQWAALDMGCEWMLDNGAFSGKFSLDRWVRSLSKFVKYAATCKGVIAPDAVILDSNGNFVRGDWQETLKLFNLHRHVITDHGLPVAYALQDDHPIESVPFDSIDCLFVAGTSEYKESINAERISREALRRGIHVHIGRVSSLRRMRLCHYADSYDGTTFKWSPEDKHRRFDPFLASKSQTYFQQRML